MKEHRLVVLLLVYKWGYNSMSSTYYARIWITKATSNLIAYDHVYQHVFIHMTIVTWDRIMSAKIVGDDKENYVNFGSVQYVDNIENQHPGYLYYSY